MVSIIVPVYNGEKYINRCIQSILNQTYQEIECIIVDDGSKDRTYTLCNKLAEKDNRIKVIHKENSGVQAAREDGVRYCNGDYVMFVDADDYIDNTILEIALKKMQKSDVDIVCFNYISNGKKGFAISEEMVIGQKDALKNMLTLKYLDGNLWGKLYKTHLVKNIKFEKRLYCNFVTCSEIIGKASRVAILPKVGYCYSVIDGSLTHYRKCNPKIIEYERTTFQYYQNIVKEEPELKIAAEYFWLRSLLWINIKMEKDNSFMREDKLFKTEKNMLRKNISRFFTNPYFDMKDKLQFLLCYFSLFRSVYTVKELFDQFS